MSWLCSFKGLLVSSYFDPLQHKLPMEENLWNGERPSLVCYIACFVKAILKSFVLRIYSKMFLIHSSPI